MTKTIVLVSCVSEKVPFAAPANQLYCSDWFQKAAAYAVKVGDELYILSAKYGLLSWNQEIEPYNMTLRTMPAKERRAWASRVLAELQTVLQPGDRVIILAGKFYREYLVASIIKMGCEVEIPLEHLGIGQQQAWFIKQMGEFNEHR